MKIGILTFHKARNYGAILQTYALQKKLRQFNSDTEIIDYNCPYFQDSYKIISFKNITVKSIVKQFLLYKSKKQKYSKFDKFIKNNIRLSKVKNIKKKDIEKYTKEYDKIIVGSDQVWNMSCTNGDLTYFLDFVTDNKRKNSYAASFGKRNITDKEKKVASKYLSSFNAISVREKDGQEILDDLNIKNASVVVDPTLLIEKKEWDKICAERMVNTGYILEYKLYNSEKIKKIAKKLAKEKKLKIIVLQSDLKKEIEGSKVIRNAGIKEFISLIKYADYVITNSFHGTIFSLIYHKEFYISLIKGENAPNSRLENLLKEYNLTNRILDYNENNFNQEIDYEEVDKKIVKNRDKSLDFLKKVIK